MRGWKATKRKGITTVTAASSFPQGSVSPGTNPVKVPLWYGNLYFKRLLLLFVFISLIGGALLLWKVFVQSNDIDPTRLPPPSYSPPPLSPQRPRYPRGASPAPDPQKPSTKPGVKEIYETIMGEPLNTTQSLPRSSRKDPSKPSTAKGAGSALFDQYLNR